MIATNPEFINEYKEYDELLEFIEYCENDLENYKRQKKYNDMRFNMQTYFENSFDYLMEFGNKTNDDNKSKEMKNKVENKNDKNDTKEKGGILSSIGEKIVKLIQSIGNLLKKITDTLTGRTKKIQTDVQIVNKIIQEHPELGNTVVEGIDKSWFTYGDVAKYKDNIVELVSMLKHEKISHKTFSEKIVATTDKFRNTAGAITKSAGTISGLLVAIPTILYSASVAKRVFADLRDTISENKETFNNESLPGITNGTREIGNDNKKKNALLKNISIFLDGFINKHGDRVERANRNTMKLNK